MFFTRLRAVALGLMPAIAICFGVVMATLKTTVAVVSTAVVVMIPGTKAVDPQTNEKPEVPTEVLQQELQGWVYQQATEGWVTNDYPRSMGDLTGSGDPLFEVSTAIGKENLDCLIVANVVSGVVGFGYSQGATVATLWLNDHANGNDPSAPSADDVSFVLIGSPNRPNGGLLARATGVYVPVLGVPFSGATPESQYAVTDVVRQYDIFADFPADPLNVFSLLNVLAGAGAIHGDYLDVDINDPANVVEVHGNTTYIMQPARTLPLADALRNIAALFGRTETPIVDAFEPALKYLVELGYDRTSQATTVPFQPGSSIVRFLNSVPEFTGTLKEGVEDLRTGRQAVVNEPESNEPIVLNPTSQKVAPVAARRESRVLPTDVSDRVSLRHSGSGKQADSGLKRASRTNVKRDVSRPHSSKKHSPSKARSSHRSRS